MFIGGYMNNFDSNDFALEVITKGSFVDKVDGKSYIVEATTVRLNHVAMNAWIMSSDLNSRSTYNTDGEYRAYKDKIQTKRHTWEENVLFALDMTRTDSQSVHIAQALAEVFTVVRIWEQVSR